jgi:class 3 adenylate cyclase
LRTRLTLALVGLGVVSVVLLATVNFFVVRDLLDRSGRSQLETLRDLRSDAVELAIDRVLARTATFGTDPGVATALAELEDTYQRLDTPLSDDELARVESAFRPDADRFDDAGVERPSDTALVPASVPGQNVQLAYVASNPEVDRAELVDAGDGTDYSAAHATHHPFLRQLATSIGASDLLLVGLRTGEVVYSVGKRIDLGTSVVDGPYASAGLGRAIQRLDGVAAGRATITDMSFYLPDSDAPLVHVATAVRADSQVVGALVITLRTDRLTDIVTAGQQWDLLGLGDTGEAYIVGADGRLRTAPRAWFDDPDAYLERFADLNGDERIAALMHLTGSPVLLQTVDNAAIRAAADGERFVGRVDDYLDRAALTASAPLQVDGLGWIIVTEQQTSETREQLERFVATIVVLLAVLLAVLVVIAALLARALARPVAPLVDAARRLADGDAQTPIPDLGRNELGDVGRQLEAVAARLREQDASIVEEEQRITEMLASALPPVLADRIRRGERNLAEQIDTATVIAVSLRGLPAAANAELDALDELTTRFADELTRLADLYGVERLHVAHEQQLFVTGRGRPDPGAEAAARFAGPALDAIAAIGAEFGLELTGGAGLASGLVATGVLGSRQMTFGAWGLPVDVAVELSNRATGGEILVDATVVDELDADWSPAARPTEGSVDAAVDAYVLPRVSDVST